ncbi:hypothetical protein EON63_08995 [archaeon]|nr:MAG: hypothetical protein EON63_08995 [archaeon]
MLDILILSNPIPIHAGILACASCGAMCAWLSPPIILNHTSMHNVWGMIEWALNTTIFLLAGLICGHRVISKVVARDWGIMLLLYVGLNVARFITIFSLYPVLSNIGHRCSMREGVFMSWAGLRGALGLALALLVDNNCPEDLHDEKNKLFFYVAGVSALTLIINGSTAKWVLVWLGELEIIPILIHTHIHIHIPIPVFVIRPGKD